MIFEQDINLYRIGLGLKANALIRREIYACGMLLIIVVVLLAGYQFWEAFRLENQLEMLQEKSSEATTSITSSNDTAIVNNASSKILKSKLEEIEAQQSYITRHVTRPTSPFSEYLVAFSRQHVKGLWLTQIDIFNEGSDVELKGQSVQSKLIPDFVAQLKNEPKLSGIKFNALEISTTKEQKNKNSTSFTVSTRELEP